MSSNECVLDKVWAAGLEVVAAVGNSENVITAFAWVKSALLRCFLPSHSTPQCKAGRGDRLRLGLRSRPEGVVYDR